MSRTVQFALGVKYSAGNTPDVDINNSGNAVSIHEKGNPDELWSTVGRVDAFQVKWEGKIQIGSGREPSIAINDQGQAACIYRHKSNNNLYYRVGRLSNNQMTWYDRHSPDSGKKPSTAINNAGRVVEIHETSGAGSKLWYRVGDIEGESINFHSGHSDTSGKNPSIAMNDHGDVVEVHESDRDVNDLWCKVGKLNGNKVDWYSGYKYGEGSKPSVSINNLGEVVVVHHSRTYGLWYKNGKIKGEKVDFKSGHSFDDGKDVSVGISDSLAVQVHRSEGNSNMYYSNGMIVNRKEWMKNEPGLADKYMWQISLPGSHDSGLYEPTMHTADCHDTPDGLGALVMNGCKTQDKSIEAQLKGGIRYFDIRPAKYKGKFHVYHSVIGPKMEVVLSDVKKFMQSVSKELVVLKISHHCKFSKEDHDDLIAMIKEYIDPWLYKMRMAGFPSSKLSDYTANGPCVLVHYDGSYKVKSEDGEKVKYNYLENHPVSGFFSDLKIYDKYSKTTEYEKMRDDQLSKLKANQGNSRQLFLLSWTLTYEDFWDTLVTLGSLHILTKKCNRHCGEFVGDYGPQYKINIVYVDYFQDAGVTDRVIALNGL